MCRKTIRTRKITNQYRGLRHPAANVIFSAYIHAIPPLPHTGPCASHRRYDHADRRPRLDSVAGLRKLRCYLFLLYLADDGMSRLRGRLRTTDRGGGEHYRLAPCALE